MRLELSSQSRGSLSLYLPSHFLHLATFVFDFTLPLCHTSIQPPPLQSQAPAPVPAPAPISAPRPPVRLFSDDRWDSSVHSHLSHKGMLVSIGACGKRSGGAWDMGYTKGRT